MLLRSADASPFVRKVRLAALHLGLESRIATVAGNTGDPDDPLRRDNPLGKIPVLVLDDGRAVYDSRVILETLDHIAGGDAIIPRDWDSRLACLTVQALADGIMDASVLIVYEGRYRPPDLHHAPWLEYQRDKVRRGLEALLAAPPDPRRIDVGTIAVACALGYLDFRRQFDWRAHCEPLIGWLDAFSATTGAFDATRPPA